MKTVVITGGTRGLGYELAKQFRMRGENVVISGTADATVTKALDSLVDIKGTGRITGKVCNVAKAQEVAELCDFAIGEFKSIDIWINNAGVNQSFRYLWELEAEEVDYLLDVDLKGAINGTRVAMRQMIKQNGGTILNVEGMGSNDAFQSRFSLYGTAKRAVTYLSDAASHEIDEKKLPVVVAKLSPGIMITDFLTSVGGEQNQTVLDEKTKKVYNILGDYPDVIAKYLVDQIENGVKNGQRISWLTGSKAAWRFLTSAFNKRDFFEKGV